jgi:hypothetical protein
VRVRIKRGDGPANGASPKFGLRCLRDNRRWTRWNYKSLGGPGDTSMTIEFGPMGYGHTFQFEWQVTDDVPVEIVRMDALVARAEKF